MLLLHASGGFFVVRAFEAFTRATGVGAGLEPTVLRLVVTVLALALALGWIFSATPEGMRTVLDESTGGMLGDEAEVGPWLDRRTLVISGVLLTAAIVLGLVAR